MLHGSQWSVGNEPVETESGPVVSTTARRNFGSNLHEVEKPHRISVK